MTTILYADPAPQTVFLRLATDVPGAANTTITKSMGGRPTTVVRGGEHVPLAILGPNMVIALRDHEILYNTPIYYTAMIYDAAGNAIGSAVATPITIVSDSGWLRDVLVPSMSVPIRMVGMESGDGETESRRALLRPLGRKNPVVVTDTRSGYAGESSVVTFTAGEQTALESLFSTGHVLLWTGPAEWGVELPRYVTVGNVSLRRVSAALDAARMFNFEWVEVDAPDLTLYDPVVPTTWQDLKDAGTVWADVYQTSWFDLIFPPTTRTVAWSA